MYYNVIIFTKSTDSIRKYRNTKNRTSRMNKQKRPKHKYENLTDVTTNNYKGLLILTLYLCFL